jgi:hypothetical protein
MESRGVSDESSRGAGGERGVELPNRTAALPDDRRVAVLPSRQDEHPAGASAAPQIDIPHIVDRVIAAIDERFLVRRERLGRV